VNGWLHREDGPAVEYDDDEPEWYLRGNVTEESVVMDDAKRAAFLKKVTAND